MASWNFLLSQGVHLHNVHDSFHNVHTFLDYILQIEKKLKPAKPSKKISKEEEDEEEEEEEEEEEGEEEEEVLTKRRTNQCNGIFKEIDSSDESEEDDDDVDYEDNRRYNHKLVGQKLRVFYEPSWYVGTIKYYSIDFKKYNISFEDGSEDYISKDEILKGEDLVLLPSESSNKTPASPNDIKIENGKDEMTDSLAASKKSKVTIKIRYSGLSK